MVVSACWRGPVFVASRPSGVSAFQTCSFMVLLSDCSGSGWKREATTDLGLCYRTTLSLRPPVAAMFHDSVTMQVGDGTKTLFWADRWVDGTSIAELAPCFCQAVDSRVRHQCIIRDA